MRGSFWSQPWFLWLMSGVLPLAVVPAVLIQEAILGSGVGGTGGSVDDADLAASDVALLIGWFLVPPLYAALHLWRYRGGATMLPLVGRGWVSAVLTALSIPISGLLLLGGVFGNDLPEADGWPFAIWMLAVAIYVQALRAAAVHRSLPDAAPAVDELVRVFE